MPSRKTRKRKVYKTVIADKPSLVASVDMPKETEYRETSNRTPTFSTDIFGIAGLLFVFMSVFGAAVSVWYGLHWAYGLGLGAFVAAMAVIWRARSIYDRPDPNIEETTWQRAMPFEDDEEDEPDVSFTVRIPAEAGREVQFRQPRPGEFASWIGDVIRDAEDDEIPFNSKTNLSQRTAESRGWSRRLYKEMIDIFYEEDWVYEGRNRVPEPTEIGLGVWIAWLRWSVPAPTIRADLR